MKTEHRIYAALGVLALLGGGLYLTTKDKKADADKHSATAASADFPQAGVPKDDVDKITKIEITSVDKDDKTKIAKVTLEKQGEDWNLTAPISAKGNASYVKSLLDNMKDLKVKELIDRNTSAYKDYDLGDDKATHAVAWKGSDKVADLYFGKTGSRGQTVRVGGRDGVFAVPDHGSGAYQAYLYVRDTKGWRDNSILKFEDANAIQVDVTNKNGRYAFSKNGETWSASYYKRDKDGKIDKPEKEWKKFDEAKVKDLLRTYKSLTADDYGDEKDKAASGLDNPEVNGGVVHIKLKDGAGDIVIKVGKTAKGTSRWAMKDGSDTLYSLAQWSTDWALAEPNKFEKSDKPASPPPGGSPHHPAIPGMDDMGE